MRIDTKNLLPQMFGQQGKASWLTGAMKAAGARQAVQHQAFLQKASALSGESQAGDTAKKAGLVKADMSAFSASTVSKKDVPKAMEGEMERYHQAIGDLVDNLTGMEERLKYMQARHDQAVGDGQTEKASAIREWNEKQYQDMSWMVGANLGISHFRMDHAQRLYGKDFGQAAEEWLGDLHGAADQVAQGLKGAGSVEEALGQIAAAKEQLMGLADEVADRCQAYSGKELTAHTYKTAEDFAQVKWDSHLLYPGGNLQTADQLLGKGYQMQLDLSQYLQSTHLVDVQA